MVATRVERVVGLVALFLWAGRTWSQTASYYFLQAPKHRVESAWILLAVLAALLVAVARRRSLSDQMAIGEALPRRAVLALAGAFAVITLLLYWDALSLGLLSDDFVILAKATGESWWNRGGWDYFRPLTFAAWRAIAALPLATEPALHATNLAFHAGNATMTVVLARRFGLTPRGSALTGLLFLVFPASVEPVAWASGIQDVAMTSATLGLCVIATLPHSRPWHSAAAGVLVLVGIGFKETAIAMPVVALTAAVAAGISKPWRLAGAVAVVCGGYLAWRMLGGSPPNTSPCQVATWRRSY